MLPTFKPLTLLLLGLIAISQSLMGQSYLGGVYQRTDVRFDESKFTLYQFSRKKGKVKAKYFAQNANREFQRWKQRKNILFYCSGAFSENWSSSSPPLGICVDNGVIVNRKIDNEMDGLVIVYNGGAQQGGIAVINLEKEKVNVTQGGKYTFDLRSYKDRTSFLNWARDQGATVFQTQLMYTKSYGYAFPKDKMTHGKKAERRFLAICKKGNTVVHLVINFPESSYLNAAADKVVRYLKKQRFEVFGLFNLDTGGKDIMKAYDGQGHGIDSGSTSLNQATNLLVYYVD
ncbi:MAG: hypothetical protein AAGI38_11545 [Bacteroidota bacterium]